MGRNSLLPQSREAKQKPARIATMALRAPGFARAKLEGRHSAWGGKVESLNLGTRKGHKHKHVTGISLPVWAFMILGIRMSLS